MTTLLDRDRPAARLPVTRAAAVAIGLLASVGMQLAPIGSPSDDASRIDGDCSAPVRPGPRAR